MKKNRGLDALRGLAALLIVIHHARPNVLPEMPKAHGALGFVLWNIRDLGWSGIDLFFVLGGFFMCDAMFADLERVGRIRLREYWKRRAVRIVPSYYLLLAVLAVTGVTGYIDAATPWAALRNVATHVCFLQNYLDQLPNGPTWFLGAMVQFYVLIPVACVLLSRLSVDWFRKWFPTIAVGVIVVVLGLRLLRVATGVHQPNDFMLTHLRIDAVLIGMLAMVLFRNGHPFVAWLQRHAVAGVIVSVALVLPAMAFPRKDPFMFTVGFLMLACGYAGLILLIAGEGLNVSGKGFVVFAAVASCSYNVYLWHYFLPRLMGTAYVGLQRSVAGAAGFVPLTILAQVALFVVVSIGVGYALTLLVERPARRFLTTM